METSKQETDAYEAQKRKEPDGLDESSGDGRKLRSGQTLC